MILKILCLFFILTLNVSAARLHPEKEYQINWCNDNGEAIEFVLRDRTRVDCMAEVDSVLYAIEFDFADKWAEAIGQALYYAKMTGRSPAIVLIVEDFKRDRKYIERLLYAVQGLDIRVFLTF